MELNKQTTKEHVKLLVDKYKAELFAGKINDYTEAEIKKGFIEPLFHALGWDTANRDEVGLETAVSGGRADYSFKVSGIIKLFVEAKAVHAGHDKLEFAEQAINYAWHKGVVWAVLTDFEGLIVFNAERKAKSIEECRFISLNYTQYLDQFDKIWFLSKESIEQGLIDKEAETWGKKEKKQPVSKQILDDLLKSSNQITKQQQLGGVYGKPI
jgi:predicted type IV restriction endonuclease